MLDKSEFSEVVTLANQSRGGYIPNPVPLAGGGIMYYITTTDGVRHQFGKVGNVYLIIDGDYYNAGEKWLSSWKDERGNSTIPSTFFDSE